MNRKIYFILFALLAWSFNLRAQTAEIESKSANPGGSVTFEITVDNLGTDVGAVSLFIGYDPNVLTYTGTTGGGTLSGYFVNNMLGTSQIGIQWTTIYPLTGEDIDGRILTLNFNYSTLGGVCDLTFDAGCEFADVSLNSIPVTYTNGSITPYGWVATITASEHISNGGPVPVTLTGAGFEDGQVAAVQLSLEFDPSILTYTSFSSVLPGVLVSGNNTTGIVGISWSSLVPVDLNTIFITLNFNFNATGTSEIVFTGDCEIAYISLTTEIVSYDNGKVEPSTGGTTTLDIADVFEIPGSSITVPVTATGYPGNVGAMTLFIGYDPSNLTFTGVTSSIISNITAYASNGVIGITWTKEPPGQSINGTVFNLQFDYAFGNCDLTFEGGCEITNVNLTPIVTQYIDGSVTQVSSGPEARLPIKTGTVGQTISFPVKVKNFTMAVGAVSLFIGFDNTVLTYTGHTPGTLTGYYINYMGASSQVGIQWSDLDGADIDGTLGDDTLLFLNFTYNGGECDVTFNAGCEFARTDVTVIPVAFFDGAVILGSRFGIKAFLEGPFNTVTATMNVNLNSSGYLPTSHPYGGLPWLYTGTESVGVIPNGTVVDWVLVEVRETAGAASTATAATMVTRLAAFLLNDGRIVGMDGVNELLIPTTFTDNVYVVIYHRNHLSMMSAFPITEVSDIYTYDFTGAVTQAYNGGLPGQKSIGSGKYGMYAGDGDASGSILLPDRTVWSTQFSQSGYKMGDYDMNGSVLLPDRIKWSSNFSKSEQVP